MAAVASAAVLLPPPTDHRTGLGGEPDAKSASPAGSAAADPAAGLAPEFASVRPVLAKFCLDCHGGKGEPEGGPDLAKLSEAAKALVPGKALDPKTAAVWRDVLTVVRAGEMPPDGSPKLPAADRARLIAWTEAVSRPPPGSAPDPGRPVLRRLTRLEYNNTVRDLLGLPYDVFMFPERLPFKKDYFDPAAGKMPPTVKVSPYEYGAKMPALLGHGGLPGDNRAEHGFANRGDVQNVSPLLMEKYLAVATDILASPTLKDAARLRELFGDAAPVAPGKPGPKTAGRIDVPAVTAFAPAGNLKADAEGARPSSSRFRELLAEAVSAGDGGVFDVSGDAAGKTLPGDGRSTLAVAFGAGKTLAVTATEDLWLVAFSSAKPTSGGLLIANKDKGRKTYDLAFRVEGGAADELVSRLGVAVLARNKESGEVALTANFTDGSSATLTAELPAGAGNTFFSFTAPPNEGVSTLRVDGSKFSGDFVLIDDLAFVTSGGPATGRRAAPAVPAVETPRPAAVKPGREGAKERFASFLRRAFRRPADEAAVERYLRPYDAAKAAGADDAAALRESVKAVLASPRFLYLAEPVDPAAGAVRALDDWEIASRLSYFLWASMPDDELLAAAAAGKLKDPAELERQTRRMLRDPKVRELSETFAVQWLRLNELWSAQPDRRMFKAFYAGPQGKGTLHADLMTEALLLIETILVEDRSVLEFVDADWGYLNKRVIQHYGLAGPLAEQMEAAGMLAADDRAGLAKQRQKNSGAERIWLRIRWPDRSRGGAITTGAVLTLTSLPQRTSPVKRGAWVLETLPNRPPKPPAVAVAPLEKADVASTATVRQKLEAHRADPNCAGCHNRIDPPGFALESFDAAGAWRDRDGDSPVDASGVLPDGRKFSGPAGFKDALLAKREEFVRAFAGHMLSYALGRKLEPSDDAVLAAVADAAARDGYKFSRVVVAIVGSPAFRTIRNAEAGGAPLSR